MARSKTSEILQAAYKILAAPTGAQGSEHASLGSQYEEHYSNSLGVGRKQRGKLVEYLKSCGLGHTEVDPMGRPKFTSDRHRRQVARAMDHIGMDSYYD